MTPPSAAGLEPARILLVEAREDACLLVRGALESAGHWVGEAANLASAREALQQHPAELVLCSLRLAAVESGLDLLQELAPRSPDIAVVMLTGTEEMDSAVECLRNGAFDFVPGRFSAEELREVVARTLQRQRRLLLERQRLADHPIGILSRFASENPNPVLRVSPDGEILYANASFLGLFGESNSRVGGRVPRLLDPVIAEVASKGLRSETEVEVGGRAFAFASSPLKDSDSFFIYGHEITRLKDRERQLVRRLEQAQAMALQDPLTGLPNRTLLQDRLAQAIAQCLRTNKKLALVFVDLDNFKPLNDTQGHQIGDQILVEFARHVRGTVRKTDTVARWGGDELILLLPGLNDRFQAREVAQRVRHRVQEEFTRHPLTRPLTLSMGVAIYPDDAALPEILLQLADAALYQAKAQGRNRVVLHGSINP